MSGRSNCQSQGNCLSLADKSITMEKLSLQPTWVITVSNSREMVCGETHFVADANDSKNGIFNYTGPKTDSETRKEFQLFFKFNQAGCYTTHLIDASGEISDDVYDHTTFVLYNSEPAEYMAVCISDIDTLFFGSIAESSLSTVNNEVFNSLVNAGVKAEKLLGDNDPLLTNHNCP
ncbi:hypothetical protein CHUAL_012107 [Chamberlinius hualienensis]